MLLLTLLWSSVAMAEITTEGLVPDASITTEDAVQLPTLTMLDVGDVMSGSSGIETPDWPTEILPEPPLVDQTAPNYLELVKYSMSTALVQRADRENHFGDIDEANGYPRRFGPTKERDYYVKIFLAKWEEEHTSAKNVASAVKALRSSLCPDGLFYVTDNADGTPFCSPYSNRGDAENGRYACAENVWRHTVALDAEYTKRFKKHYPIYNWWESYTFNSQNGCTDTIWNQGEVCMRNVDYVSSAVDHHHCGLHLFQLYTELQGYYATPFIPYEIAGGSLDPVKTAFNDGAKKGRTWKPIADVGARCNNDKNKGGAVLFEASLKGKVGNALTIYNKDFVKIGTGFFKGNTNPNRPTFCTNKYGAEYGTEPILLCAEVVGIQQCYVVANPSNRED